MIDFYKNEYASSNRKIAYNALAVLNSFKAINKVTTFGSTLLSPVYKPFYRAYYFGMNGFFVGLSEGFEDWYSYTAKRTYYFLLLQYMENEEIIHNENQSKSQNS